MSIEWSAPVQGTLAPFSEDGFGETHESAVIEGKVWSKKDEATGRPGGEPLYTFRIRSTPDGWYMRAEDWALPWGNRKSEQGPFDSQSEAKSAASKWLKGRPKKQKTAMRVPITYHLGQRDAAVQKRYADLVRQITDTLVDRGDAACSDDAVTWVETELRRSPTNIFLPYLSKLDDDAQLALKDALHRYVPIDAFVPYLDKLEPIDVEDLRDALSTWIAQESTQQAQSFIDCPPQENRVMPLDNARNVKQHAKAALRDTTTRYVPITREAGWWAEDPMGGDTPLDFIAALEDAPNPQAASDMVGRWLNAGDTTAYAALGVWDHVLTSGPSEYRAEFAQLAEQVKSAARLLQGNRDFLEEWGEEWNDYEQASEGGIVSDFLAAYADGKAAQVKHSEKFWPGHLPRWELQEIEIPYYSDDEVGVRLKIYDARNDDFVYADENVPAPTGADNLGVDSADVWEAHQGTIDLSWEEGDDYGPKAQIVVNLNTQAEDLDYEIEPNYEY